jgi:hypothetical protein
VGSRLSKATTTTVFRVTTRARLRADHPTAAAFLDETGIISQDRFFSVGCLILPEPSDVIRKIEKLRDRQHWYTEFKWANLTQNTLPLYRELIEIAAGSEARFSCFVADRDTRTPLSGSGAIPGSPTRNLLPSY